MKYIYLALIAGFSIATASQALVQEEAIDILSRYEEGATSFKIYASSAQSWTTEVDTAIDVEPTWTRSDSEFVRDGDRIDERITEWRGLESRDEEVVARTGFSRRVIGNGELWLTHKHANPYADIEEYVAISQKQAKYQSYVDRYLCVAYTGYPLDGVLGADLQSVATILRDAENLTLLDKQEEIAGSPCYVLEGSTPAGDYKLWIDPSKGHNIVQAESMKREDNLYFGSRLGAPWTPLAEGMVYSGPAPSSRKEYAFRLYDVQCELINGVWIPMSASYGSRLKLADGRTNTIITHYKRLNVDLEPDFEALGAFVPSIPDGVKVYDLDIPQIEYEWLNGSFKVAVNDELVEMITQDVATLASREPASGAPSMKEGTEPGPKTSLAERPIGVNSGNGWVLVIAGGVAFVLGLLVAGAGLWLWRWRKSDAGHASS